nr:hypothetical protein [Novosphingobium ginsenosidimutans]
MADLDAGPIYLRNVNMIHLSGKRWNVRSAIATLLSLSLDHFGTVRTFSHFTVFQFRLLHGAMIGLHHQRYHQAYGAEKEAKGKTATPTSALVAHHYRSRDSECNPDD